MMTLQQIPAPRRAGRARRLCALAVLTAMAASLSGCVVYERPHHYHPPPPDGYYYYYRR